MIEGPGTSIAKVEIDSDCNKVDTTTGDPGRKAAQPSDNRYFRRYIDESFQRYGSQRPEEILNSHYIDKCKWSDVEQYVNDFATKSEECVYEKMRDCTDFVQVTNWCELMHSAGLKDTCNHELALAVTTLANTERFPQPKFANGVNFKLLYSNLSNMMMGHPIKEMDPATSKVLKDVYEDTVAQMKQTENYEDTDLLRSRLQNILPSTQSSSGSLNHENLEVYFADSNLNPLQIPFEKLFYVTK